MTLDYHVVDVFTDRAFAGNPLAVVLGGDHLSTEQMQAIASEFNLSETTFPVPPTTGDATYRLRIFTPASELPFAGHPSVGTAWLLRSLGRVDGGRVVQECGAGLLPLQVDERGATLTGGPPRVGEPLDVGPFCAAVGLDAADAVGTPVRWSGTGLDWAYLHVHEDAVRRARPVPSLVDAFADPAGAARAGICVVAWSADGRARSRVFGGGVGVAEDPATGSAALGLGGWLVASGLVAGDGESAYRIEQGAEIGRPSQLSGTVVARDGRPVECRVTGSVVAVAQGRIAVP
ncbi:MAG TPA: PhzF family phenazine biosynthesis protein [Mycobacteriales bacterium]|nr:PhzF family phenazine biosynthesis protein [Mycobacteriales bacterium]